MSDLQINDSDINWSKVKMTSYRWIAIRHNKISHHLATTSYACYPQLFSASSDSLHNISNNSIDNNNGKSGNNLVTIMVPQMETSITIVNPYTNQTHNCETSSDTKCAQINPQNEIIGISNDRFLAVYCVHKSQCLNTLPFPSKCIFWNWINNNIIAIITERDVFHWDMNDPYEPQFVFKLNEKIKNYQITGYKCDKSNAFWFAVSSLFVDEEGIKPFNIQIFILYSVVSILLINGLNL